MSVGMSDCASCLFPARWALAQLTNLSIKTFQFRRRKSNSKQRRWQGEEVLKSGCVRGDSTVGWLHPPHH